MRWALAPAAWIALTAGGAAIAQTAAPKPASPAKPATPVAAKADDEDLLEFLGGIDAAEDEDWLEFLQQTDVKRVAGRRRAPRPGDK